MTSQLSETHERVFYSTLTVIEQKLHDMEIAMQTYQHPPDDISRVFKDDVGEEQKNEIKAAIAQMRATVKSFYTAFNIKNKETNSLRKDLEIKATFLWEHLADSTAKRISGYGILPPDVKIEYENRINSLIQMSEELITTCKKTSQ